MEQSKTPFEVMWDASIGEAGEEDLDWNQFDRYHLLHKFVEENCPEAFTAFVKEVAAKERASLKEQDSSLVIQKLKSKLHRQLP